MADIDIETRRASRLDQRKHRSSLHCSLRPRFCWVPYASAGDTLSCHSQQSSLSSMLPNGEGKLPAVCYVIVLTEQRSVHAHSPDSSETPRNGISDKEGNPNVPIVIRNYGIETRQNSSNPTHNVERRVFRTLRIQSSSTELSNPKLMQ
jgi:hypothetical protein